MEKRESGKAELDFKTAFKYPFNRAKALLNILWILLPIIGWFALGGYYVRIVKEFSKGKFKKLPTFKFDSDMKLGFFMFLKAIPFVLLYMAILSILVWIHPWLRIIVVPFEIFAIPILFIHFMNKETVGSLFEFKIVKPVLNNLGDYIVALFKDLLLAIVFFIMWIVLVGIPAGAFKKSIFSSAMIFIFSPKNSSQLDQHAINVPI